MIGRTLLHYHILQKLGEGGQGAVYKATDTKLGRTVVLKVLPPELTVTSQGFKRFEREAKLASSLDHQNICTIFDFGEADSTHFIVMQYVEGQNVRQLVNGRPLELGGALSVAVQVTDALVAAHGHGIIHRDIKANNVMVTKSGQVKVLDFGLAKLLDEEAARAHHLHHTELTEVGVPYGTATYAAPEQAAGGKVDHRADIFSTGVLLYEMLTGTWPFRGKTTVEVRYAVMHDVPRPASAFRTDMPPRLQQILDRALAKNPADRYQKVTEMRDDLRRLQRELAAGGGASESFDVSSVPVPPRRMSARGGVAQTLQRWLRSLIGAETQPASTSVPATASSSSPPLHETQQTSTGSTAKHSLAILPFRNLSNDPAYSFYEFALADAVITELARLRRLVVRPSSLMAKYQGTQANPEEVGRELGVDTILAAGFLAAGGRLRVNAQLFDVTNGIIVWSDRIDADASDIFAVQDQITQRIVEGVQVELSADERVELARRPTDDPAAYEEYLRGRDRLARYTYHTPAREDFGAAVAHFRKAVELDPSFALAYAGLGACYIARIFAKLGGAEDYESAGEAFKQALALDPKLVEARLHMVSIYLAHGEKQRARDEIKQLLREAPNDATVHRVAANLYRLAGKREEALKHFARAAQLNPEERVNSFYNRARIYMVLRRPAEALGELNQATAIEPEHPLIKTFTAFLLYHRQDYAAAIALTREVLASHPEMDSVRPLLAMCLSRRGQHEEARAELTERVRLSASTDPDIAYWLATAYALEEMPDEAFEWLERAVLLGREDRAWYEADEGLASLHSDPRFPDLLSRIGSADDPMT